MPITRRLGPRKSPHQGSAHPAGGSRCPSSSNIISSGGSSRTSPSTPTEAVSHNGSVPPPPTALAEQRSLAPRDPPTAGGGERLSLWFRLYLYAIHGIALDVLLSAALSFRRTGDWRLFGFSSPYFALSHALVALALEKAYVLQKRLFPASPVWCKLVLLSLVFVASRLSTRTALLGRVAQDGERAAASSVPFNLLVALYYTFVFLDDFLRLRYARDVALPASLQRSARLSIPPTFHLLFFGVQGLVDEVFFTAFFNLFEKSDWTLHGHTSLWSFAMYGSCSFVVERLYLHLAGRRGWGTLRRLPVYIACIYTWEFTWGLALRQIGACSWDYSHYPLNFMGLITLMYLPGWVLLSLYQDVLSNVLLRLRYAEQNSPYKYPDLETNSCL
ncbi:unnamed protein product [Lampetra fluviatilis]